MENICFVVNKYPNEFEPYMLVFLQQLAWEFADMGKKVTVICPLPVNLNRKYLQIPYHTREYTEKKKSIDIYWPKTAGLGQSHYVLGRSPVGITTFFLEKAAERVIRSFTEKPDVIYGHFMAPSGIAVARLSDTFKIPAFFALGESHNTIEQFGAERAKEELKDIAGVIAVSTYLKRWIVDAGVLEDDKVEVFPNGINGDRFKKTVIMPQFYGEKKEWLEHWKYLLQFFRDDRYIKIDGKPVLIIYRPESIECLSEMLQYWRELAFEAGFPGMVFMNQSAEFMLDNRKDHSQIDFEIEYEPINSRKSLGKNKFANIKRLRRDVMNFCEKKFGWDLRRHGNYLLMKATNMQRPSYDEAWKDILTRKPHGNNSIPCAFVNWDNSPRYHERGQVYIGANPEKFKKYFSAQIKRTKEVYHKDMMFIFAWNEWGEGGYLEPDEENKYGYLEAVRDALKENDEFPW